MKKVRLLSLFSLLCFLGIGNNLHAQCESTTIQTTSGATMAYTCPGDGNDDLIDFENSGNGTTDYVYVATDQSNNILGVNPTATFNFEGAGTGTCYIWGFSYTGNLTAQMGDFLWSTPISDGCFQISDNRVNIVRDMPDGGTIQNNAGSNSISVCTTDDYSDVVNFSRNTSSSSAYTYVITDADNNVLAMTTENSFDFNGVPAGVCRIWGLSYTGNIIAMAGDNAATATLTDGCFDLSDNFIEVTRIDVDGGTVADDNGATELTVCAGDDLADVVNFTHVSNSGAAYGYIVTDDNNNVLGLPGNSIDFNGAGTGICRVWGISYTGNLTIFGGDNIMNKTLSDDCFDLSDNYIEVDRTGVEGGTVYTTDAETTVYTCPGDGVDDVLSFMHSSTTGNFVYVITELDGTIIGIPPGNSQNFEGAGTGTCLVWGLSFTGEITAMAGDNALTTALSDGCFALSENFVSVVRDNPDGGTVSTVDGATTVYTCPGNGINDIFEFAHVTSSTSNYAYVVTDNDNNILGIPPGNSQNFEGAPAGTCRVWGLSYTGNIIAGGGDNAATTTLTDGCFELSSNFVTVVREQPSAGTLDADGAKTIYTCPGDGNDDIVDFTANGFNQNYRLVVTDSDYNVLGLPPGNTVNFEGAGTGTCLAWGVSYTGDVVIGMGDNIFGTQFSSDCWDFSEPVTIVRDTPDGGTVNNNTGNNVVTVCTTDGNADVISYTHTTTSTSAYTYLITDADNNILGIHPLPDFNFEGVPPGVCRIWGLSYSGELLAAVGNNAATSTLSAGCAELSSNFIEVTRTDVDGGTVAMPSGATERYTCTQDGNADVVMFTHVSNSPSAYRYVITDDNNNVLGLPPGAMADFDGAPAGTCRVWGLSYTGDVTLFVGDNIMNKSLSTDCYDLSENYISIIRDTPEGGTVAMPSGATERYTCTQDGTPDVVMFTNQGASNSNYAYVITSPTLEILGIEFNDYHDFDNAPPGTCWVWGLSYTGSITAQVGDQADQVALTDDCFDLSDNFISVIRDMPDGGTVQTIDGATEVTTIAGDGIDDIIEFESLGTSNSNFAYVITDDQNNILGIPPGNSQNFEGAGVGICRVWGLSYTGNILVGMGDNAATATLTDDCFSLSSNYIEVNRAAALTNPGGSTLTASKTATILDLAVSPNPATDYITINIDRNFTQNATVQLQILNVQGQVIMNREVEMEDISANGFELNVNSFDAGVYFLNLRANDENITKRFVKL